MSAERLSSLSCHRAPERTVLKALKVIQLRMVFYILIVGLALAIVAFAGENLVSYF